MDNQNDGSPRAGVYPGAGRSQISRPHATQAFYDHTVLHEDALRVQYYWNQNLNAVIAQTQTPRSFDPFLAEHHDPVRLATMIARGTYTDPKRIIHESGQSFSCLEDHEGSFLRYPRESQEMVFDAHDRAFRLFQGACRRGIYDNMKTAVQTVLIGKERAFNPAGYAVGPTVRELPSQFRRSCPAPWWRSLASVGATGGSGQNPQAATEGGLTVRLSLTGAMMPASCISSATPVPPKAAVSGGSPHRPLGSQRRDRRSPCERRRSIA